MTDPSLSIALQPFTIGDAGQTGHLRRKIVCRRLFRERGIRLEAEFFQGKHYAAYLPRYSKRYVMLLEQEFPPALTAEKSGKAISYFMPVLHEPVYREAGGRFHYHSNPRLDQLGAVGCCGGISIDRQDLSLGEHEQEFDNVVSRMRHLGFR